MLELPHFPFSVSGTKFSRQTMARTTLIPTVLISVLLAVTQVEAGTCLTGGCHQALTEKKYLHGPIAAEQAGVTSCVTCHIPAGEECSESTPGSFKPLAPAGTMCQTCHTAGNDSLHTAENIECLECHDPHGSDTSPVFERKKP